MLRHDTKTWARWMCLCGLLLTTGCGDDGGNMDGSVPEDGGPDARMDADVDKDAGKDAGKDADVDASDRDSGECRTEESTIYFAEREPTDIPWDGLIVDMEEVCESCPQDFQEGLDEAEEDVAHAQDAGWWCSYSVISGCGFEVIVRPHSAYHFDAETGLLVGAERISDVGFQRGECSAAELMFGERIPECPERTETSLCNAGDGGPDGSVGDAGADSGMDSGTQ